VCGVNGETGENGEVGEAFLERGRFACVEREVRFERFGAFERLVCGAGVVRHWLGVGAVVRWCGGGCGERDISRENARGRDMREVRVGDVQPARRW